MNYFNCSIITDILVELDVEITIWMVQRQNNNNSITWTFQYE